MSQKFYSPELEVLNASIVRIQQQNHFGLLWDLKEIFSPKPHPNGLGWTRISTKGNLRLCDYNCGLFCVSVTLSGQGRFTDDEKKSHVIDWYVHFHVGNADDSSWGAWSQPYNDKEKCLAQVNKTAEILNDLVSMPDSDTLNEMLRPFGLYGELQP